MKKLRFIGTLLSFSLLFLTTGSTPASATYNECYLQNTSPIQATAGANGQANITVQSNSVTNYRLMVVDKNLAPISTNPGTRYDWYSQPVSGLANGSFFGTSYIVNQLPSVPVGSYNYTDLTLPVGNYYVYCDVPGSTPEYGGNPFCPGDPYNADCKYTSLRDMYTVDPTTYPTPGKTFSANSAYIYNYYCTPAYTDINGVPPACISWQVDYLIHGGSPGNSYASRPINILSNPPTITSLNIKNNGNNSGFTSSVFSGGRQTTEGGANWFNPMTITLTTSGSPTNSYVAFYDKAGLSAPYNSIITGTNPSTELANWLSGDPRRGFILQYDNSVNPASYKVWDPVRDGWQDIPLQGYQICGRDSNNQRDCSPGPSGHLYYQIVKGSGQSWDVYTYQAAGSKTMYTGAYVLDSANNLSTYQGNIAPIITP